MMAQLLDTKNECNLSNLSGASELHIHVRWVPCHHGMAHPQVADGGDALQV
jgi:hypothetical protein